MGLLLRHWSAVRLAGVLPYMWQAGAQLTDDGLEDFTFDTPEALEGSNGTSRSSRAALRARTDPSTSARSSRSSSPARLVRSSPARGRPAF